MVFTKAKQVLGQHETKAFGRQAMLDLLSQLSKTAPELGRFLLTDGFGGVGPSLAIGYCEWALLVCAILVAIGDAGDQLEVNARAAIEHGATGTSCST